MDEYWKLRTERSYYKVLADEALGKLEEANRLVTYWADKHGALRHELAVSRELVDKLNGKVSALESRFLAEKEIVRQLRTSNSYAVYEDLTEQLEELMAECERLETSNQTAHKLEIAWATKYEEERKAHEVTKYELARISQIPVVTIEYNGRKHTMARGDRFQMTHMATVVYE